MIKDIIFCVSMALWIVFWGVVAAIDIKRNSLRLRKRLDARYEPVDIETDCYEAIEVPALPPAQEVTE